MVWNSIVFNQVMLVKPKWHGLEFVKVIEFIKGASLILSCSNIVLWKMYWCMKN